MKKIVLIGSVIFAFQAVAQCDDFEISLVTENPTCFGSSDGSIMVNATGGTGSLDYSILDEDGNVLNPGGSNVANILNADCYSISVSDEAGCEIDTIVCLEDMGPISIDVTVTECTDSCNASISVDTVYGYNGSYELLEYNWIPGSDEPGGINVNAIFNLCDGVQFLVINDQNGCSYTESIEVECFSSTTAHQKNAYSVFFQNENKTIQIVSPAGLHQVQLNVYSTNGRMVIDERINTNQLFQLPTLSPGIYLYQISDGENTPIAGKFVIQN